MTDRQREGVRDWIEHFATMLEADYLEQGGMLKQRCFDDIKDWLRDLELTISEEPQDTMNIVQVQFYGKLNQGKRYTFRIPKGVKVKKGEYLKDPKGELVRATADSIELPPELIETWIMGGRKVTAEITTRLKEEGLE